MENSIGVIGAIQMIMVERNLSNADLVKMLPSNIRDKDISPILSGKRSPSAKILDEIAKALDCDWVLSDLMSRTIETNRQLENLNKRPTSELITKKLIVDETWSEEDKTALGKLNSDMREMVRKRKPSEGGNSK